MQASLKLNFSLLVVFGVLLGGCTATQSGSSIGTLPTPSPVLENEPLIQLDPADPEAAEVTSNSSPSVEAKATVSAVPATVSRVLLDTTKGVVTIELNAKDAPNTVQNFLQKMQSGAYTNRIFHRVEEWVIQGGDPLGNGTGGGSMPTELSGQQFGEGSVGVARGGDVEVSNADQFFICTQDCSWLTGQYTHFGKVVKGMDVAKKITVGEKILSLTPVPTASSPSRR